MLGDGFWVWDALGEIPVGTGCWAVPTWEAKPCSRNSAAVLGGAQIHPVVSKTLSLGNQESAKVPVRAGKEPWLEMRSALLSQTCWGSGASPDTVGVSPARRDGKGAAGVLENALEHFHLFLFRFSQGFFHLPMAVCPVRWVVKI